MTAESYGILEPWRIVDKIPLPIVWFHIQNQFIHIYIYVYDFIYSHPMESLNHSKNRSCANGLAASRSQQGIVMCMCMYYIYID